jgi:hypothetical protein
MAGNTTYRTYRTEGGAVSRRIIRKSAPAPGNRGGEDKAATRCTACQKKYPIRGSDRCFFDSYETPDEANGMTVVTADRKRAARTEGGLLARRRTRAARRTLPRTMDLVADVAHRLDTLEEVGTVEAELRAEIRGEIPGRAWSYRDASLQVQLILAAIRRVDALEKLRHARDVLIKGRRTSHLRVSISPEVLQLGQQHRSPRRIGPGTEKLQ